jgi:hypothetical protein
MTGVMIAGPWNNETSDDYVIRIAHKTLRGSGEEQGFAHLELVLTAFQQLDDNHPEQPYDTNGSKLVTSVYNLPESVHRDIELKRYDNVPWSQNSFLAMDKFGIFGKIGDSRAGFMIDCFTKEICPTKTLSFAQSQLENEIRKASTEIFGLKNNSGDNAYTEIELRKGLFDLKQYGIEPVNDAAICTGELKFGENGKHHGEIVRELMNSVAGYSFFKPEQYLLSSYEFKIENINKDNENVREIISHLKKRHTAVFEEKARKCA